MNNEIKDEGLQSTLAFAKLPVSRSITAHRCSGCGAKAEIYNERWDLYVCGSPKCKPDDIMRDIAWHAMTGQ